MNYLKERAKVVRETFEYGQGYGEEKFGFSIGDRVFWVGIRGYGHEQEHAEEEMRLCTGIVDGWNTMLKE